MTEVAGAIAGRHGGEQYMLFLERLFLEGIRLLRRGAGRKHVPLHVDLRGGDQLSQQVSLVERRSLPDLGRQLGGHGGVRLIVMGVMVEDGGIESPVLVELRRELYEISRSIG